MILALIFASGFALLYDDAFMQIIINDRLFPKIYLKCGVRHGDPLSPLSDVLCVEVLFSLTSGSPEIKAFLLPGANAYCPFRGCAGDWVKLGVAKRHGAVLGDAICLNSSLPCVLVDVVRCKMGKFSCCVPGCKNYWRNGCNVVILLTADNSFLFLRRKK